MHLGSQMYESIKELENINAWHGPGKLERCFADAYLEPTFCSPESSLVFLFCPRTSWSHVHFLHCKLVSVPLGFLSLFFHRDQVFAQITVEFLWPTLFSL